MLVHNFLTEKKFLLPKYVLVSRSARKWANESTRYILRVFFFGEAFPVHSTKLTKFNLEKNHESIRIFSSRWGARDSKIDNLFICTPNIILEQPLKFIHF